MQKDKKNLSKAYKIAIRKVEKNSNMLLLLLNKIDLLKAIKKLGISEYMAKKIITEKKW